MIKKKNFPTTLFVIVSLCAFVFFGLLYIVSQSSLSSPKEDFYSYFFSREKSQGDPFVTSELALKDILSGPIISFNDPFMGYLDAPVVIVNFSDFECAFCHEQEKVIKKIIEEYGGKVSYVWKDFPELVSYSNSWKSAVAARCADEQDKFWEYHDLLFVHVATEDKSRDFYVDLAKQLDLRESDFQRCLDNPEIATLVHSNILEAQALDVYGIPFFYINDTGFMGELNEEELKEMIDAELFLAN